MYNKKCFVFLQYDRMKYLSHSIIIGLVTTLYALDVLWSILSTLAVFGLAAFGFYLGIALALNGSKKYYPPTHPNPSRTTSSLFEEMTVSF